MKNVLTKHELYEWAGESYLTESLPKGWQVLLDDRLYDWIAQNTWEPFEHWPPEQVWAHIDMLAFSAISRFELEVIDE